MYGILKEAKLIYSDRKQINGFLGLEDSIDLKGAWGNEHFTVVEISCLDFSSGYIDVFICQNSLNYTLKMGKLIVLNYTSKIMIKKKTFTELYHV